MSNQLPTVRGRARAALPWGFVVALLLVGGNLRAPFVAVAPIADRLRSDLGVGAAAIGVLTSLPVLCFGVFAPVALHAYVLGSVLGGAAQGGGFRGSVHRRARLAQRPRERAPLRPATTSMFTVLGISAGLAQRREQRVSTARRIADAETHGVVRT